MSCAGHTHGGAGEMAIDNSQFAKLCKVSDLWRVRPEHVIVIVRVSAREADGMCRF